MLNLSWRKVGGVFFLKLGRFGLSFWVSKEYRPVQPKGAKQCMT